MKRTIKQAAIYANMSALRLTLMAALDRARDAETAMGEGQVNQAIGAALGIETMLEEASALFGAVLALHRGGKP